MCPTLLLPDPPLVRVSSRQILLPSPFQVHPCYRGPSKPTPATEPLPSPPLAEARTNLLLTDEPMFLPASLLLAEPLGEEFDAGDEEEADEGEEDCAAGLRVDGGGVFAEDCLREGTVEGFGHRGHFREL